MKNILKTFFEFITENKQWLFDSVGTTAIVGIFTVLFRHFRREKLSFNNILNSFTNAKNSSEKYIRSDFLELVNVKKILKKHYPDYSDYIVIQYGSSVRKEVLSPNDYDFIVLLLGHSTNQELHTFKVGSKPEKFIPDLKEIDVVFRDYLSFLFALVSGMPYENSVVLNGQIVYGHKGYFLWLKRTARNILIDRDFLIRRFENDKIPVEKRVWNNTKNTFDTYEIVRAAYFLVSSLLQRNRIRKMGEVIYHQDIAELAFVENLKDDISNPKHKEIYEFIIQSLKRRGIPRKDQKFVTSIENVIEELM